MQSVSQKKTLLRKKGRGKVFMSVEEIAFSGSYIARRNG